jgi:hypothetical protein
MGRCQKPVQDTGRGKQLSIHNSSKYNQDLNGDCVISFAFFLTKYVLLSISFAAMLRRASESSRLGDLIFANEEAFGRSENKWQYFRRRCFGVPLHGLDHVEHQHKKGNKIGNAVFFITGHASQEACKESTTKFLLSRDDDLATWTIFWRNNNNNK